MFLESRLRSLKSLDLWKQEIWISLPSGFDFAGIPGLSTEAKQKLERVRPQTLGQAGRIPGITPAAVAVLDVYLSLGAHA